MSIEEEEEKEVNEAEEDEGDSDAAASGVSDKDDVSGIFVLSDAEEANEVEAVEEDLFKDVYQNENEDQAINISAPPPIPIFTLPTPGTNSKLRNFDDFPVRSAHAAKKGFSTNLNSTGQQNLKEIHARKLKKMRPMMSLPRNITNLSPTKMLALLQDQRDALAICLCVLFLELV